MPVVDDKRAILAITEDPRYRWNADVARGTPSVVTYHFLEGTDLPPPSQVYFAVDTVSAFTQAQRASFALAADRFEAKAGLVFVEVDRAEDAMIGLHNVSGSDWAGFASYPYVDDGYVAMDGTLVMDVPGDYAPGGWQFAVLLHELGHMVGLEHPHEGRYTLTPSRDTDLVTLLSYNFTDPAPTDLGPLDIEALRHLYGPAIDTSGWRFDVGPGSVAITGGAGDDTILSTGLAGEIRGGAGDDLLIGRASATLRGGTGDDTILGGHGTRSLLGGGGDDSLVAGESWDVTMEGGSGHDTLRGADGWDKLLGSRGADRLIGDAGRDTLDGGDGADALLGGWQDDRLVGGQGTDELHGGRGNDRLNGNRHADILDGGSGNDALRGGSGADKLKGGSGADTLTGGSGDDKLIGGDGSDVFVFDGGHDVVVDWQDGEALRFDAGALGLEAGDLDLILSAASRDEKDRLTLHVSDDASLRIVGAPADATVLRDDMELF